MLVFIVEIGSFSVYHNQDDDRYEVIYTASERTIDTFDSLQEAEEFAEMGIVS